MCQVDRRRPVAQCASPISFDPDGFVENWPIRNDEQSEACRDSVIHGANRTRPRNASAAASRRQSVAVGAAAIAVVTIIAVSLFGRHFGQQFADAPARRQEQRQTSQ